MGGDGGLMAHGEQVVPRAAEQSAAGSADGSRAGGVRQRRRESACEEALHSRLCTRYGGAL